MYTFCIVLLGPMESILSDTLPVISLVEFKDSLMLLTHVSLISLISLIVTSQVLDGLVLVLRV